MIPLSQLLNESARVRCQQQEPLRYRMRPLQADPSFTDLQNCEIHRIYELLETMVSEVSVLAKSGIIIKLGIRPFLSSSPLVSQNLQIP